MLSGWMWTAKEGGAHQQGMKTFSACLRDAYYVLIVQGAVPSIAPRRAKLRAVA